MLFPRHAARDKYSEMADGFMDRVNDGLAVFDDVLDIIIDVRIHPSACWGGVMLSPLEQNTTIGERMLRRSTIVPSTFLIMPAASLLPMNSSSTINWISSAFR